MNYYAVCPTCRKFTFSYIIEGQERKFTKFKTGLGHSLYVQRDGLLDAVLQFHSLAIDTALKLDNSIIKNLQY